MAVQPLKVAVCLLTYNRLGYLKRTLDGLLYSGKHDLYVYDNGSTDGTREHLQALEKLCAFNGLSFNPTDNSTAGYGMNRAIEMGLAAKPDIILFTADDYRYYPNWFDKFVSFWRHAPSRVKLATLNIEPSYPWNTITGMDAWGGVPVIYRPSVGGSQWSFRVDDIDLIYPLREVTGGEDLEVCKRIIGNGWQIAAMNLSEHIGERDSVWGNRSWTYAKPLPDEAREWIENE